jgi:protein arginine kinase
MRIKPILDTENELMHKDEARRPIVLSTRIRLARNLRALPFPGRADVSQRRDIFSACSEAISGLRPMKRGSIFPVGELTDLEKQILVERHLISRELAQGGEGTGVQISRDQSFSIMINEEDHLRIQILRNGFHLKRLWKTIDAVDSALEDSLDFAFSAELGYLTSCPTNVGTGMRASAMLHLPGLVISSQMEKVVRAVNQLGITVRGLFGEGSDASGSIFQISNQQTLGESEEAILKRLTNVLKAVVEQESNAREKLLEKDQPAIFDKIGRAAGILQNAWSMTSAEAMNLLSLMRLAVDVGALPEDTRQTVDRYLIDAQPGHVQLAAQEQIDSDERDRHRAGLLRDGFADLPALDFSAVGAGK